MSNTKHTPGPWRISTTNSLAVNTDQGKASLGIATCTSSESMPEIFARREVAEANARLIAAAPLMHMALEAHAAWHWAENTTGVSTFHENMELCNYSQWLTARALAQAAGMPHTEDFSGVPRMLIGFDGARIDRATQQSAQAIVDRIIDDYRAAIAKATGTK